MHFKFIFAPNLSTVWFCRFWDLGLSFSYICLVHSSHEGWRASAVAVIQKRAHYSELVKPDDVCNKSYTECTGRLFKLTLND